LDIYPHIGLIIQSYDYPPDQAHVLLNRRHLVGQEIPNIYTPKIDDIDYTIVGTYSKLWHVYDNVFAEEQFDLVLSTKIYKVYEKIQ
jgi:hypothetical protein